MNKNSVIPFIIIIIAAIIGGFVLFSGKNTSTYEQSAVTSDNLRVLELSVPDMFCAGCTASVEGYISAMQGVKRVQARLTPTKSATVVYNPNLVTKEEIIKNQVFDLYGVSIISDTPFDGSVLPDKSQDGLVIPQEIQDKSNQAVLLLEQKTNEGKDVSVAQSFFNQVNSNLELGNFSNANTLLDTVIKLLQDL